MQTVIIVIHLMVVSAMIGLVLLQKSEGGGLGMGGGGGGFLTSRGTANVLTRATAILAAVFFATSLMPVDPGGLGPQAALDPAGRSAPGAPTSPAGHPGGRRRSRPAALLDRPPRPQAPRRAEPPGAAGAVRFRTARGRRPGLFGF